MTKDPVCGMQVDPTKAAGTSEYQEDLRLLLGRMQAQVRQQPTTVLGQIEAKFTTEVRSDSACEAEGRVAPGLRRI